MINFPQRNWTDYGGEVNCKPFRHHSVSINTTLHLALAIGLLLGLSFISIVGGKRSEV